MRSERDGFFTLESGESRIDDRRLGWLTVKSRALGGRADISVYIPDNAENLGPLPLVILLHGIYGSHWAWTIKGGAHRTAGALIDSGKIPPMMIAMPSDGLWKDGSGYIRHTHADYEKWIVEEVSLAVQAGWPEIRTGKRTFISGLSMGGYGALRLGLKYRHIFEGISAHSSITSLDQLDGRLEDPTPWPLKIQSNEDCLTSLIENLRDKEQVPPMRFDCGTGDILISQNRAFHQRLTEMGIDHIYQEFPGGHTWNYWMPHLKESLQFFGDLLLIDKKN